MSLIIKAKNKINRMLGVKRLLIFSFIFFFTIYFITSAGPTPYDYFTRLSSAFLKGKLYLDQNLPWLNELIPAGENKFYVAYPPMPAILSIPFLIVLGQKIPQQIIAHFVGAALVVLTMLTSLKIKKDLVLALWVGLLIGMGSIVWFLSANGAAWYFGQVVAALFMTAALWESLGEKRLFWVGIFIGAMYLSRVHTILSIPIFIYLLKNKLNKEGISKLLLGFLPFLLFNFFYNHERFGVIWDKGYLLIPGVLDEPWYQKGLVHVSYITRHLKILFASFPIFQKEFPYIIPSWAGLSIWITTPAFVYSLKSNLKDKTTLFAWLSILLVSVPILTHGTTGFTQFGYRFAVDFYPLLTFLTIKGASKTSLKWHHWLLLFVGIIVNFWGVIWINKFGWVGF